MTGIANAKNPLVINAIPQASPNVIHANIRVLTVVALSAQKQQTILAVTQSANIGSNTL